MLTVFSMMRALPGGPFDFEGDKSLAKAVTDNLERRHHLDWSEPWQFVSYVLGDDVAGAVCETVSSIPGCDKVLDGYKAGVSRGVIRGDLGMAMRQRSRTINGIIGESFPVSLQLGLMAIGFGLLTGILGDDSRAQAEYSYRLRGQLFCRTGAVRAESGVGAGVDLDLRA